MWKSSKDYLQVLYITLQLKKSSCIFQKCIRIHFRPGQREKCDQIPREVCTPLNVTTCSQIPIENCQDVPTEVCNQVPLTNCHDETQTICEDVQELKCNDEQTVSCRTVPRWIWFISFSQKLFIFHLSLKKIIRNVFYWKIV